MITAVSLNPSIDRTITLDRLNIGGLNRVKGQTDVAAGKGVNVALAVAALGAEAECIGFMQKNGGELFRARLQDGGSKYDFVECEGSVRVNLKLFDSAKGEITEINSSGLPVNDELIKTMTELVRRHAAGSNYIILSGSLPPECASDYYAVLGQVAGAEGCRVILDADGEKLKMGMKAKPFMIKPNRFELEQLMSRKLETIQELLEAANSCIEQGVNMVVVSMGSDGALITNGETALHAKGMKIEVRSTVAAGDSMLAALAVGLEKGMTIEEAFRMGVAAATVRCMTDPEKIICAADVCEVAQRVEIQRLC